MIFDVVVCCCFISIAHVHIHTDHSHLLEGTTVDPCFHYLCKCIQFHSATAVMAAVVESTTHRSTSGLVRTMMVSSDSHLPSFSPSSPSSLHPPLHPACLWDAEGCVGNRWRPGGTSGSWWDRWGMLVPLTLTKGADRCPCPVPCMDGRHAQVGRGEIRQELQMKSKVKL